MSDEPLAVPQRARRSVDEEDLQPVQELLALDKAGLAHFLTRAGADDVDVLEARDVLTVVVQYP